MDKYCKGCDTTKPITMYYTNGRTSVGTQKYKPTCRSCELKSARKILNAIIEQHYGGWKCQRCGFQGKPIQFDCHHRDPSKKEFPVSQVSKRAVNSPARLLTELEKCDLLCACCHRLMHELG